EKGIASFQLGTAWEEAVGHQIAAHTHPLEIRFDTLTLLVDEAVWMHQLSFMKKEIIEKVNRFLGKRAIRVLRFRISPLPPRPDPPEDRPVSLTAELAAPEAALLNEQVAAVTDDDLKKAIHRAMRRHLGV
ncbi:MAG: DUF721 domain-containing protein, partial [Nitrospiria bacterium]